MSFQSRLRHDRTGGALIMALLLLSMLMGVGALAVDAGMLYVAHGDAQQVADAAALAGASAFTEIVPTSTVDSARARALDFGTRNTVLQRPVATADLEVEVIRDSAKVRVSVRPTAVPTWFTQGLGLGTSRVSAASAAAFRYASTATCVKPFSPPDPGGMPAPPPPGRKRRTDWGVPGPEPYLYGQQILLLDDKSGAHAWVMPQSGGTVGSCPYQPTGSANSSGTYRSNICNCNMSEIQAGAQYDTTFQESSGTRKGATIQGVAALVAQDAVAYWDDGARQVQGSLFSPWSRSPRVVVVPLYDAANKVGKQLSFTRFIRAFVEGVDPQGRVYGRYLGVVGTARLVE